MNGYRFEDLAVGMEESFCRQITEEMMREFLAVTEDTNPLHLDDAYARAEGYEGRVVYGMLTASLISTMGGVYLPGENCLIQGVEVKFAKPVYCGDTLTVTGRIVEIHESVRQVVVKLTIKNQRGETVCRGKLKGGVRH